MISSRSVLPEGSDRRLMAAAILYMFVGCFVPMGLGDLRTEYQTQISTKGINFGRNHIGSLISLPKLLKARDHSIFNDILRREKIAADISPPNNQLPDILKKKTTLKYNELNFNKIPEEKVIPPHLPFAREFSSTSHSTGGTPKQTIRTTETDNYEKFSGKSRSINVFEEHLPQEDENPIGSDRPTEVQVPNKQSTTLIPQSNSTFEGTTAKLAQEDYNSEVSELSDLPIPNKSCITDPAEPESPKEDDSTPFIHKFIDTFKDIFGTILQAGDTKSLPDDTVCGRPSVLSSQIKLSSADQTMENNLPNPISQLTDLLSIISEEDEENEGSGTTSELTTQSNLTDEFGLFENYPNWEKSVETSMQQLVDMFNKEVSEIEKEHENPIPNEFEEQSINKFKEKYIKPSKEKDDSKLPKLLHIHEPFKLSPLSSSHSLSQIEGGFTVQITPLQDSRTTNTNHQKEGRSEGGIQTQIMHKYADFSITSQKPLLVDRFKETTNKNVMGSTGSPKLPPASGRPPFAGLTGGGPPQQQIPSGKPWPARPEDYADFSITSQKPQLVDRFKETTNKDKSPNSTSNDMGLSGPPKLPSASGRPPFAGLTGGGPPQLLIPSGKPWPARPEDYTDFSITSQKPQLIDRFKETTNKDKSSNSTANDVMGSSGSSKLPSASGRPPFAGLTGGGPPQQLIPSGKPWPARPEDYADFSITSQRPQLIDRFKETTNKDKSSNSTSNDVMGLSGPSKLPSASGRPPFAGLTGGGPPQQQISSGKPWPARPEDYADFSITSQKPQLVDRFKETTNKDESSNSTANDVMGSSGSSKLSPAPGRPPFAGLTGGGPPQQLIPSGKPWPARPEDYADFSITSQRPQLVDRFKETTDKDKSSNSTANDVMGSSGSSKLPPASGRPPFAGLTGGGPPQQLIPSGKPWPARPEDYADFSITSQKPQLVDRFKETTNKDKSSNSTANDVMGLSGPSKLPSASGRPPFAGLTGGGPPQQQISSGKPWPARPEDYADFSITSQKPQLVDRFKETTNKDESSNSTANDVMGSSGSSKLSPAPGRPPFAGLTGGGPPQQLIPSGKPWPARPEDYADFSITSQRPQLVDRFKETTDKDKSSNSTANDVMGSSGSSKLPPASGRPPFAGLTGGGPPQQLIPSGKPWPARPEDYADFSITSQKPQLVDRFKETTNKDKSSNSTANDVMGLSGPSKLPSASGRPPFAGLTGGGPPQQQISSGKPWPARPEDYADFSITSQKPQLVDRFKETTNKDESSNSTANDVMGSSGSSKLSPAPGRPPFAGLTGGGPPQQLIPSGKPWPARPEDYADFSITSQRPQLVDRFKETTDKDKSSNSTANDVMGSSGSSKLPPASGRPPFAGLTGGGPPQQLIPSGKPWPARPEDYADFSITSQKPQLVDRFKETTNKDKSSNSTANDVMGLSGPSKLPSASGRPPFAGLTGGGPPQQQISSGKPWPARPEDYADFSITSQKPQLVDRFKETTNKDESSNSTANDVMGSSGSSKLSPAPGRPPFAGLTGGGPPQQLIPSGKPWPARPEDYADFSITSQRPQLVDRFKETTDKDKSSNSTDNDVMGLSGSSKLSPAPGRPPFAGLTGEGPPQQQILSGKPWPARPEDYADFSITSQRPQLVDRFKETTNKDKSSNLTSNDIMGLSGPPKLPSASGRPPFAGLTGGGPPQQQIPSGKPWPARPADYADFSITSQKPQLVDRFKETTNKDKSSNLTSNDIMGLSGPPKLPSASGRPPFAGLTGGGPPQQQIPSGKPWPARPEDYADFSITSQRPQLVDRFKETTNKDKSSNLTSNDIMGLSGPPKLPSASGRPPFAGLTGGGPPQQQIPSGKPWPARPADYADFSITSQKPQLVDRFKETTNKDKSSNSAANDVMGSSGSSKLPSASGRPPFAGLTGRGPLQQLIPSGKPWPAGPEDYADFSITSQKPQLVDRFKETTNKDKSSNSTANDVMGLSGPSKLPSASGRPPFAGLTGGGPPQQQISSGKPWPARPEDYADFSITSQKPQLVDRFKETTNKDESSNSTANDVMGSSGSSKLSPAPGRPPFAGLTGGGPPQQLIPSGKPWPARPEDYADFSITSQRPQLVDRFKETTDKDKSSNSTDNDVMGLSGSSKLSPAPGRPPFAGLTGEGPPQQQIPSGKPWPARPEDYADFSITSQRPQLVDRFKETTNKDKSSNLTSNDIMGLSGPPKLPSASGRPPFAGLTGGGPPQQQIPSGKPWPARPADYADFSITSQKPQLVDRFKETTNKDKSSNSAANDVMGSSGSSKLPSASGRPPFAGLTGRGPLQQLIPSGKPWPAGPEDYADFSITSQKPQLVDRFKETTNKDKSSNSTANDVMGSSGSSKLPSNNFQKARSDFRLQDSTKLQRLYTTQHTRITSTAPQEITRPSIGQASAQSYKQWPSKHADEMFAKIKQDIFFSKRISLDESKWPEVSDLLLPNGDIHQKIFKHKTHVNRNGSVKTSEQ